MRRLGFAVVLLSGLSITGCGSADALPSPQRGPLSWAPPRLSHPKDVWISPANAKLRLDPRRDYVLHLPRAPLRVPGGLVVTGGRNVVLIAGEIRIGRQGVAPEGDNRRALYLKQQTGTIHVEGVRLSGPGLSEGIDLDQRLGATVQLENIRVEQLRARDEVHFADNHPDVVQSWAGPARLRIDGLTGRTDYQGMFLLPRQFAPGLAVREVTLRRVNLAGSATAGYLLWRSNDFSPRLDDVWVDPAPRRPMSRSLWPHRSAWPGVRSGAPTQGDFVPLGLAGPHYTTPGYR
jgi:hypothetical protein